jgi:hypothetical protein
MAVSPFGATAEGDTPGASNDNATHGSIPGNDNAVHGHPRHDRVRRAPGRCPVCPGDSLRATASQRETCPTRSPTCRPTQS